MRQTAIKRLEAIEARHAPKPEGAYLAFINSDGTVRLHHHKNGERTLKDESELNKFIEDNKLDQPGHIRLLIVNEANVQGERPHEL